ncbi:MAG: PilZ domain-containing protein [Pirellulaceae bacterium]|jgi:hypothetical protein|nr:PilZ domain-containing protein [Pirellulaceae bacterium]MDP7015479.1 PilZ domain-containing protein [Pirellulaceae bacterium]
MSERETFVPRKPRHRINDGVDYRVEFEFGAAGQRVLAQLADFSRNGCRLTVDAECLDGDPATLHLELPQIRRTYALPGSVRWRKRVEDKLSVGLVFQEDAPLEILGELILMGVIDQ